MKRQASNSSATTKLEKQKSNTSVTSDSATHPKTKAQIKSSVATTTPDTDHKQKHLVQAHLDDLIHPVGDGSKDQKKGKTDQK